VCVCVYVRVLHCRLPFSCWTGWGNYMAQYGIFGSRKEESAVSHKDQLVSYMHEHVARG
jgi:hypothetical protein